MKAWAALIPMMLGIALGWPFLQEMSSRAAPATTFGEILHPPGEMLLAPDLIVLSPRSLSLRVAGGERTLRFSTTFANLGAGPFEVIGQTDTERGLTTATQKILRADGEVVGQIVGEFVYHPTHRHWHIDDYVRYQLWEIDENNEPATLLRQTEKQSFCIWDEDPYDLDIASASAKSVYSSNCVDEVQGMSVGWSDTYQPSIDGQELDITGIADGTYLFRSLVNPDQKILETDYNNNTSDVFLELRGNTLRTSTSRN